MTWGSLPPSPDGRPCGDSSHLDSLRPQPVPANVRYRNSGGWHTARPLDDDGRAELERRRERLRLVIVEDQRYEPEPPLATGREAREHLRQARGWVAGRDDWWVASTSWRCRCPRGSRRSRSRCRRPRAPAASALRRGDDPPDHRGRAEDDREQEHREHSGYQRHDRPRVRARVRGRRSGRRVRLRVLRIPRRRRPPLAARRRREVGPATPAGGRGTADSARQADGRERHGYAVSGSRSTSFAALRTTVSGPSGGAISTHRAPGHVSVSLTVVTRACRRRTPASRPDRRP